MQGFRIAGSYLNKRLVPAQPFLIRRVFDPAWAPVFVDDTTIILLKRNEINASIIEKYELPQSVFKVVKT